MVSCVPGLPNCGLCLFAGPPVAALAGLRDSLTRLDLRVYFTDVPSLQASIEAVAALTRLRDLDLWTARDPSVRQTQPARSYLLPLTALRQLTQLSAMPLFKGASFLTKVGSE